MANVSHGIFAGERKLVVCEDCGQPTRRGRYPRGLPPGEKKRWCHGCAKVHYAELCEDCKRTKPAPSFGLPSERKELGSLKQNVGAIAARRRTLER